MADILDSLVITYDSADASDVDVVIDYDDYENEARYGDTNTFYADEDIYLLVQVPPGWNFVRAIVTSGRVVNLGEVTRTAEATDVFFYEDEQENSIQWYPQSNLSITNVHLGSTPALTVEDRNVTSSTYPVIVDFSYSYRARSLRVEHPSSMNITGDETFPVGIVIEVSK